MEVGAEDEICKDVKIHRGVRQRQKRQMSTMHSVHGLAGNHIR